MAPTPLHSVRITGNSTQNAATSPSIPISDTAATYDVAFFQRMVGFQSGGMAVWINEYDASGNWLSGQWLGGRYAATTETSHMPYRPTSAAVLSVQLDLYVEANSVMTLYLDEVSFKKQ